MTVSTSISRAGPYAGAGTVGPFAVNFRFLEDTHLRVIRTDTDGSESTLSLTSDYFVSGAGGVSGSITLVSALAVGQKLTVLRDVPATQEADYVQNDAFSAESHEASLDKLTMLVQQVSEGARRALRVPASDALYPDDLPVAATRANKLLSFDNAGNPVAVAPVAQSATALQVLLAAPGGSSLIGYTDADGSINTVQNQLREHDAQIAEIPQQELQSTISKITAFFMSELTDYRGDTMPNCFRRVVEYRRPIGGGDIFDVVAEKSINTTAAGYCLRYFAGAAEKYTSLAQSYIPAINRLAYLCISMQHTDPRKARYGGFALAPKDGTASAYAAAMTGMGLLAAYRVTKNPTFLESCRRAAQFLSVLNNPNPTYTALYGVTPIPAVAQNAAWSGFCDQISAGDTITTMHSTWNLLACKFLKELYEITGTAAYEALYLAARNWGAAGVTSFQDFWSVYHAGALPAMVSNNWFATGLTVSDGAWHRRGESVISGSVVTSGATVAAAALTITLGAGASAVDEAYTGMAIRMTSGASNAKGSVITAYDGTTKVATLRYPFPVIPTAGDTYQVGLAAATIGSDQMEYGIEALHATGYSIPALRTAYETISGWPNADAGPFGLAYDSRICWTGYFRPEAGIYGGASKAFGTQYDVQGIGPLLRFKKEQYPEHWAVSFEKALTIPDVATLADKDFETIWSTDPSGVFEYTTVGTGTVKGTIGLGILESINA